MQGIKPESIKSLGYHIAPRVGTIGHGKYNNACPFYPLTECKTDTGTRRRKRTENDHPYSRLEIGQCMSIDKFRIENLGHFRQTVTRQGKKEKRKYSVYFREEKVVVIRRA